MTKVHQTATTAANSVVKQIKVIFTLNGRISKQSRLDLRSIQRRASKVISSPKDLGADLTKIKEQLCGKKDKKDRKTKYDINAISMETSR